MKRFIAACWSFLFSFLLPVLARHKPLWLDELFGQQAVVQRASWPDIV